MPWLWCVCWKVRINLLLRLTLCSHFALSGAWLSFTLGWGSRAELRKGGRTEFRHSSAVLWWLHHAGLRWHFGRLPAMLVSGAETLTAESQALAWQAVPVYLSYLAETDFSLLTRQHKKYISGHCRTRGLLDENIHLPRVFFPLSCSFSLFLHALK